MTTLPKYSQHPPTPHPDRANSSVAISTNGDTNPRATIAESKSDVVEKTKISKRPSRADLSVGNVTIICVTKNRFVFCEAESKAVIQES
jgi:hypothetical protein